MRNRCTDLGHQICLYFFTYRWAKYSTLNDEWLYKAANDELFVYELYFLVYD